MPRTEYQRPSRLRMAIGFVAYLIVICDPTMASVNPYTRFGRWCLSWAGVYAFTPEES